MRRDFYQVAFSHLTACNVSTTPHRGKRHGEIFAIEVYFGCLGTECISSAR